MYSKKILVCKKPSPTENKLKAVIRQHKNIAPGKNIHIQMTKNLLPGTKGVNPNNWESLIIIPLPKKIKS